MVPKDKARELVKIFTLQNAFDPPFRCVDNAIIVAEQVISTVTKGTAKWLYWQSVLTELKSM